MSSLAIRACRSRHCSADVLLRRSNPASLAFFVFPGRVDPAPSKKFPAGLVGSTEQLDFYVQPPTIGGQSCFLGLTSPQRFRRSSLTFLSDRRDLVSHIGRASVGERVCQYA